MYVWSYNTTTWKDQISNLLTDYVSLPKQGVIVRLPNEASDGAP